MGVVLPIGMFGCFLDVLFDFGRNIKLQFDWMLIALVIDDFIIIWIAFPVFSNEIETN